MYNFFNKTICVCYDINSSSGLLFIMCGYCYYKDPAAVRTWMQTNFTVHGQPPQFPRASAANGLVYTIRSMFNLIICMHAYSTKLADLMFNG